MKEQYIALAKLKIVNGKEEPWTLGMLEIQIAEMIERWNDTNPEFLTVVRCEYDSGDVELLTVDMGE